MGNKTYLHEEFFKIPHKIPSKLLTVNSINVSGIIFTLFLSKMDELSINKNELLKAADDLADEIEKYAFKTDAMVKTLLKKDEFNKEDMLLINNIVSIKTLSGEINTFVTLLNDNNPKDYAKLINLSENIFENVRESYNIVTFLDMDITSLNLCIDHFKLHFSMLIDEFKKYIMGNFDHYIYPTENEYYSTYKLGYIMLCVDIIENILNLFPLFNMINMDPLKIPANIWHMLISW